MFRRVADWAALGHVSLFALAACVFLGLALRAAWHWTGGTPAGTSAAKTPLPDDHLIIMDWDDRITRFVPLKCVRTGEGSPATPVRREDLADSPAGWEQPMDPAFGEILLRDVRTGELHEPSGIWCWTSVDGTAGEVIDGRRVVDAVFDETTDPAAHRPLRTPSSLGCPAGRQPDASGLPSSRSERHLGRG